MGTSRKNGTNRSDSMKEITVKMKVVEILEGTQGSLRVGDVVRLLQYSRSFVYQLIARGELPARRVHGSIRLDPNHVIEWLQQHQTPPVSTSSAPQKSASAATSPLQRAV